LPIETSYAIVTNSIVFKINKILNIVHTTVTTLLFIIQINKES